MGRTPSQNVVFVGPSSGDDIADPPGRSIAKAIVSRLRADQFAAADEDNWRDCGWSIQVPISDAEIEVALAQTGNDKQWIAQVAPSKEPGFFAQLFGRRFMDRSVEVLAVSRSIHRWLLESQYRGIWWCVDAFPEEGNGSDEPIDLSSRQSLTISA